MAVLEQNLQEQIDKLVDLAYENFQNNKIEKSFDLLKQAWGIYPKPENNWNEAYNIAKYIFLDYMKLQDYDNASEWLNKMIDVNNNLHQSDEECAFYIGQYLFEIEDYNEALKNFNEVVEIAGFRYFEEEDPKYLDFYKNPDKYINQ